MSGFKCAVLVKRGFCHKLKIKQRCYGCQLYSRVRRESGDYVVVAARMDADLSRRRSFK